MAIADQPRDKNPPRARLNENPAPPGGKSLNPTRTDQTDAIEPDGGTHLRDVSDTDQAFGACQALIDAMGEGAVMVTPTGTIAYCNSAFAQLAQHSREGLTGADFRQLVAPAERPRFEALLSEAHAATARGQFSLLGPDGGEIALQLSVRFSDDAAHPNACMVVGAIREPERREERMRQLNTELAQRIANLVEASADAILSVDLESKITDVNERTCVLTGFARQELIGRHFDGLFTDSERAAECIRTALAERTVKNFELSFRTRDGEELPLALGALAFGNSDHELQGVFVAARDISERQRVERERSLLATIVESSTDAIYSVARDTIVTSWNRGAEQLYGYAAQEMAGQSVTICVPLARRTELVEQINKAFGGQRIGPFDTVYRRKDGNLIDVSVTMSPIDGHAGEPSVAMIARDVTRRRRLERELTQARDVALEAAQTRSQFLANMSHEIRTPLNSIMGMTMILLDTGLSPRQKECASAVQESSQVLLSIIEDILDFSKMASGKLPFEKTDFDLEATVASALEIATPDAQRKGLEVALAFEADVPRLLCGDAGRLRQVLVNLLSNAVKFTEHGEIVVRVNKVAESPGEVTLRFEVRDTGIGIPKAAQGRLFQAFSQLDSSDSREHGGTGLGLAIARGLVERMAGSIGVLSESGAGSTFWFTGKFAKQSTVARVRARPLAFQEPVRVLVVDDNETNRDILEHQLRFWNFVVDTAPGAEQALGKLRDHAQRGIPYRIALLDLQMPVMDGLELARWIRGEPAIAETVLIMLSSMNTQASYDTAAAGLDIMAWLVKPPKPTELHDALAKSVARGYRPAPAVTETEPDSLSAGIAALGAAERKLRALIVEDNATNKEVAQWHLERLGFAVDAVGGGGEALAALERIPYDVVLMDCRMPKLDGYETTRRIRRREGTARHTKIVAMTAHALIGDREKCLAAGMDDYVSKPVEMNSLIAALNQVLGPRTAAARMDERAPALESAADGSGAQQTGAALPAADCETGEGEVAELDEATMASLRAKGDLLDGLIGTFLDEMPGQLTEIAKALAQRDGQNAAVNAHGLKGAAATFGAARMGEIADRVREAAERGAIDGALSQLEDLRAECERVRRALNAERGRQIG